MSYEFLDSRTFRFDKDGSRELMCNFVAKITEEIRYVDGITTETFLTLEAEAPNPNPDKSEPISYPAVRVSASAFPGMGWVMSAWGVRAIIQPGGSIKDDLRTAIQSSSDPVVTIIYRHMGWVEQAGPKKYLHAGGAITKNGNDPSVSVQLPHELRNFRLEATDPQTTQTAVQASLALIDLGPPEITWPMLAATIAPLYGPVDYAMHLTGRTGTFKSELSSLFQCHYGVKMDGRHLPGSWSSTPNALEAQAYYAKNALFTVDDFVPTGTSWQQRAYQTTADKIIRSQGNQSGRARLTDTSNLQTAMYPRGIILSTGEDTPEGHSIRARMLILELSPNQIDTTKLTRAQANRQLYQYTTSGFVQYLCGVNIDIAGLTNTIRDQNVGIGHTRTPSMLGSLIASIRYFLDWALAIKAIKPDQHKKLVESSTAAITAAAKDQTRHLESTDPCDLFCQAIRRVFGAGLGHLRTTSGGIPKSAETLGWVIQGDSESDLPMYKSNGPCIGWISWSNEEIYINAENGYNVIRKAAGPEISLTKQTMLKRLKDSGHLTRTDEVRQRNTVRVTAEKHPHQVLSMSIPLVLDTLEVPSDGTTQESSDSDRGDAFEE